MGMEEEEGVCLAAEVGGEGTKRGKSEGRVGGSWQQTGETERWSQREVSQAFSNHFGTLSRRGCPGGTKSLGFSLWVPDLCQARMVWQRGKQLLPSASFPNWPHHPVVFSFKVP